MSNRAELTDALRLVAQAEPKNAPATLETRLLARFRAQRRRRRWMRAYSLTAAACLLAGVGWLLAYRAPATLQAKAQPLANGFVALPYAQSDVPLEEAVVVRVKLNASELETMGVPVVWMNGDGNVSADLLVGQDGVARAVRLVR